MDTGKATRESVVRLNGMGTSSAEILEAGGSLRLPLA